MNAWRNPGVMAALAAAVLFGAGAPAAKLLLGSLVLSWPGDIGFVSALPALAVVGACFSWAIDNNLTRKIALADATFIAMIKGIVAGVVNVTIAWTLGATFPSFQIIVAAGAVGFFSFGASLVLFVVALRHLGAARTGAYFSIAPFAGAMISFVLLGETVTATLVLAGLLMGAGVWLHLTERHDHMHAHDATEHTHEHVHDEHHQHQHDIPVPHNTRHTHRHGHDPVSHVHPHYPDAHHGHQH